MKKTSIICALFAATAAATASEPGDTLNVTSTQATIIETATGVTVTLKGKSNDPDYTYTYHADYPDGTTVETVKEESQFDFDFPFPNVRKKYDNKGHKGNVGLTSQGIMFGFAGGVNVPAGAKVDMGRSLEFDWLHIIGLQYDCGKERTKLSIGFGLGMTELKGKNGPMYIREADGSVGAALFPEESYDRISTMYDFKLHFPFIVKQPLGGDWRIMAAASLDVRTHCRVGYRYKIGEEKFSYDWTGVPMQKLGYSIIGAIGNSGFGLYCKWQPKGMIKKGFGPDFDTVSVGFIVGF